MLLLLQSLLGKHRFLILGAIALLVGAFGLYKWGYSTAEQKYKIQIAKQQALIVQLQNVETKIEKEIVTVYKDRVKTVTQVRDRIIEVTPNVLSEESKQCRIGSGFIGLHNSAANNQDISESARSVDAAAATTRAATE